MATYSKTTGLNCIEITIDSLSIAYGCGYTIRVWLAGINETGIQTSAAAPRILPAAKVSTICELTHH